jgi:hypothetical protein
MPWLEVGACSQNDIGYLIYVMPIFLFQEWLMKCPLSETSSYNCCMPVKMQTVSVKAINMYVSYVKSLNCDTLFPNQNFGKLDKNSMMICPHLFDYDEICNCLVGLLVVLNGIHGGG